MKVEKNVDLKNFTTFRMGGIATTMYTPETEEELINLMYEKGPQYFVGGGSNLIINEREFENVVNLRAFNTSIEYYENGVFVVGASVRLQNLITTINEKGYGGIEYLFSVPGLVGGAVVMNAGRGKAYQACISDYILEVKILRENKVEWITKEQCMFDYRSSIFSLNDAIILAVRFKFPEENPERAATLREERKNLCKQKQDNSAPNFGTVFCESDKLIMQIFKLCSSRRKTGIVFSNKTSNWMLNKGGSFEDVLVQLERVKKVHKFFRKKCRVEAVIWE